LPELLFSFPALYSDMTFPIFFSPLDFFIYYAAISSWLLLVDFGVSTPKSLQR
jgi:hypothetical protein